MQKVFYKLIICTILCGCFVFLSSANGSVGESIIPKEFLTGKTRIVYMADFGINNDYVFSMQDQELQKTLENVLKRKFKDYPQLEIISASSRRTKIWESRDLIVSLKLSGRRELKNSK